MRRALYALLALLLLPVLAVAGLFVALNTAGGRHFAEREINRLAAPGVRISGLGGHFPADLRLATLNLADPHGVWLTATGLTLRWQPLALLGGDISIAALNADTLAIVRAPAYGGASGGGGSGLPRLRGKIGALHIGTLSLPAALAGEAVALRVDGGATLHGPDQAGLTLDATTPDGRAQYHLAAALDRQTTALTLHVAEPPGGLLGHFAGLTPPAPLRLDATLNGPRDAAALTLSAALGAAQLSGTGTLGLGPGHPFADVTLTVPHLAPFTAMAGNDLGGTAQFHLTVSSEGSDTAILALDSTAALTNAPPSLARVLGKQDTLHLKARLHGNTVTLEDFQLTTPAFTSKATGHLTGQNGDYAATLNASGEAAPGGMPTAPFTLALALQHLPNAPVGTLTASGELEHAPITLEAALTRSAQGGAALAIPRASWRSLSGMAELRLPPGATLPTGTASLSIAALQDLDLFLPYPLRGAARLTLTHPDGQDFRLDATAIQVQGLPGLGALTATLRAQGPEDALAVQAQLATASLQGAPASASLAATINLPAQTAHLTRLSGAWRGLAPSLTGPAEIEAKNGLALRHLGLALDGGRLGLDGTLTPRLAATAQAQNLPLALAQSFAPGLGASGEISASAQFSGTLANPVGKLSLHATGLHVSQGIAASLPPADLTGTATLTSATANLALSLTAGPQLALTTQGGAPLSATGPLDLRLDGSADLRLLNAIIAAQGNSARGLATAHLRLTGTPLAPQASGTLTLADGAVENIGAGLNLTKIQARFTAQGRRLVLASATAQAGAGQLSAQGTLDLSTPDWPVELTLHADHATPTTTDLLTETLDGDLALRGALRGKLALSGALTIDKANINIPTALPTSVADLPIIRAGETPPPPPPPPPPIALALDITAHDEITLRGQGLFAVLGGHVRIGGTAANPAPQGGFTLIHGDYTLAGKTLQFTRGRISFTGAGFEPTLDLEASTTTSDGTTATLTIGGTAEQPKIILTSTPPLPSDEILSRLLFGQGTASLSPFQAASLAAALAQLAGVGAGLNPIDKMRDALGLDELSLSSGSAGGPPSVQAGRYVAPGVYVGASQATNGQGTQANVQINLYKGLKLQSATGTSTSGGGQSSSVGLSYQFNY